ELTIKALAPNMRIIAPWRIWDIKSRDDAIDYANERKISIPVTKKDNYSRDRNIWHLSHEGSDLEDPSVEPDFDKILKLVTTPENAPDKAEYVEVSFESGIPVALNGTPLDGVSLLEELNEIGGRNGVGIVDITENRLVGMKSRGVYETPGGSILYYAHNELEYLCLDRETYHYKEILSKKFGDLIYNGQWFTPLREALSVFFDETQKNVTGTVRMKLYKGNIISAGTTSAYSLHDEELSTFGEDGIYNQSDAEGFINLFGLPLKVKALKEEKLKGK
ncbi:MAG: argininosuccinate synthase, partial [Clostridia bacterium]|nr:argininosuccinate synthase [Clostridia bacterium]